MTSPFLTRPPTDRVAENDLAFALRDAFPVAVGHTLVIPKRHVATWFDASREEQVAILDLVDMVKGQLDDQYHPDGYNVGFNAGSAAGQTVMHLHVHVIPRYHGDVPDPRGGVRHTIPSKGNYLTAGFTPAGARTSALTTGGADDHLLHHLQPLFVKSTDIAILAAFAQHKGVEELEPFVLAAADRGARVRLITGDYLHITQREALSALLGWMAREAAPQEGKSLPRSPEVRIVESAKLGTDSRSFHPKSWRFEGEGFGTAYVGSSNVSRAALRDGVEWNLRVDRERDRDAYLRVAEAFEVWWHRARPLDAAFLQNYQERLILGGFAPPPGEVDEEPLLPPPEPHEVQLKALAALAQTRQEGRQRTLVVMATGLGKTWLAAFDVHAVSEDLGRVPRLLFLAHRDELLRQAARTFHCQFPEVDLGFFAGSQTDLGGTFVFASVQKLSLPQHLKKLEGQSFDYVVVDEVHHATALTYRRILAALNSGFVIGLTATPDRADEADIRSLFDDHIAFRADIAVGIEAKKLSPFHYFGLKDTADYRAIPWRNGRFDPEALAAAVETQARMEKAWEGWQAHAGTRTLVFCCTIPHARYVCAWLAARGVRVVAVHSEGDSADRVAALEQLGKGELDAVCAVDLFNEGIDVPTVDRVVMLRPSESPVIFLQQLGRGLRRADGKEALTVLDFVGNHRVFLDRLRTLLAMAPADVEPVPLALWLESAARRAATEMPEGCSINIDIEAIDLLASMLPRGETNALVRTFQELVATRGIRPTAGELYRMGLNPRVKGGWFGFVEAQGAFDAEERQAFLHAHAWLTDLDSTRLVKSFKMVTLQALVEADALLDGLPLDELCRRAHDILVRSPELYRDIEGVSELGDPRRPDATVWRGYWRKNPVAAWLGESAEKDKKPWFALEGDTFAPRFQVPPASRPALARMVAEMVDWRLAEYRARSRPSMHAGSTAFEAKVTHNQSNPILILPDRAMVPGLPDGETPVTLPDGRVWSFRFVKIACNVATAPGEAANRLPELLRGWFGPLAGQSGTAFHVRFLPSAAGWRVEPVFVGDAQVIPFAPRVRVSAFSSLKVAAGWQAGAVDADSLYPDGDVELPGPIPPGCFAVRATGRSMEGWRAEVRDGDWLVCKPLEGADFAAVAGEVVIVARGEDEARSFHVKRVTRSPQGGWVLRSDNPETPPMPIVAGDSPLAVVRRVVRPEDIAPEPGMVLETGAIAAAFGISREPSPTVDRVGGHLFFLMSAPGSLPAPDTLMLTLPNRKPGETAFVLLPLADGRWRYAGVGRWDDAGTAWSIPEVDFDTWRALGSGRTASRRLEERWLADAGQVVEDLLRNPGVGAWVGHDGKRCRLVGPAAKGGLRIDGGPGGFAERTVSLADIGWVLAARAADPAAAGKADEARVNQLRYLLGTPKESTRWIDSGWAIHLVGAV
jgi:superfamily II DNA or RNA helicase/diadenosine tetraphosphate (Ap4A) HIT family hydrolase/HKD family nuclease